MAWDILRSFVKKKTLSFASALYATLKIDNTDVIIDKDIPVKIVCKRNEYFFLPERLKQKNIYSISMRQIGRVIFTFKQCIKDVLIYSLYLDLYHIMIN